ncbi:flagellar assembly protein FliW [Pseudarthrobacter phenanthrenivorans]|uniref:flagellar assembly protein FliW n=1 Tax=Pseudarthrobacter phenanthrenivorans TaxID=361575 RepID=UPI00112BE046|nr:flagellar assembly protein FliW [Pseudarthrobacter phenanthrenivorans]TPV52553.1 flagellar assembly protein FliW [Pseudarthrobacter phenanthrenivorans]
MSSVTFTAPPPGLAPYVDFSLDAVHGAEGLFSLRSTDEAAVRLFLVDPAVYAPGYRPALSPAQLEPLGPEASGVQVLLVANPGEDGTTVNLMAPILLNPANGICSQVVLEGSRWPVRAQLPLAE